jgi:hypothetical protein
MSRGAACPDEPPTEANQHQTRCTASGFTTDPVDRITAARLINTHTKARAWCMIRARRASESVDSSNGGLYKIILESIADPPSANSWSYGGLLAVDPCLHTGRRAWHARRNSRWSFWPRRANVWRGIASPTQALQLLRGTREISSAFGHTP